MWPPCYKPPCIHGMAAWLTTKARMVVLDFTMLYTFGSLEITRILCF